MYGHIYLITHLPSGKYYVGQTRLRPERRWSAHCSKRTRKVPAIDKAIADLGAQDFAFEVLFSVETKAELDLLERLWIIVLQSRDKDLGFNIRGGGWGGPQAEETRRKLSEARQKQVMGPEHMAKAIAALRATPSWNKGKKCPQISAGLKGKSPRPHVKIFKSEASINARFKKGLVPWNKGQKCPQISAANIGRKGKPDAAYVKGSTHPNYGKPAWNRGKPRTEQEKINMRAGQQRRLASRVIQS